MCCNLIAEERDLLVRDTDYRGTTDAVLVEDSLPYSDDIVVVPVSRVVL